VVVLLGLSVGAACGQVDQTTTFLTPPGPGDGGVVVVRPDGGRPPVPDAGFPDAALPPDAGPLRDDGSPCARDSECAGGTCLRPPEFPDGYCSQPCQRDAQCDRPAGWCVRPTPELGLFCAAPCEDAPCRPGYACTPQSNGRRACIPARVDDGEPCTRDTECAGGTCLQAPGWPSGHCTTVGCESDLSCAGDAVCAPGFGPAEGLPSWCGRRCRAFADCRGDYACLPLVEGGEGLCMPDRTEIPMVSGPALQALDVQCGLRSERGVLTVPYEVPAGARSYMVTVFSRDGRYVIPVGIQGGGVPLDFLGVNAFQAYTTLLHGFLAPVVVPAAPQLAGQLAPGPHTFTLNSNTRDACVALFDEATPGATLDLNVYLVGLPGLTPETAPQHRDLQAMLTAVGQRLGQAGVQLGQVRYPAVSNRVAGLYGVIRDVESFYGLMATSTEPAPSKDALLSLNLFLVRDVAFSDGSGVIGISSGLPGPGGVHGTKASGVVGSAAYLGVLAEGPNGEVLDGNDLTGSILGHELGHFLGLHHTSELDGLQHDMLADTPECGPDEVPFSCPDLGNLMFPLADIANTGLTPGQAFMLHSNPLTKD
jgi:hypothetical protein